MSYNWDNVISKKSRRWLMPLAVACLALLNAPLALAQAGQAAPVVKAFTPFKVIGNIYYVGDTNECVYLITTPAGHILLDTGYAETVPIVKAGVEKLGFRMQDIKIMISGHAHSDHVAGHALVKQMTGAQVMAMTEDVPALRDMKPGGKEHPIDKVLHDGEEVTLGGTTLVAHLTPGHTRGCTTWTMKAQEGGRTYDVMFGCSLRPTGVLTPALVDEFTRSFKLVHALPCDVQLGDHGAQYNMQEKYAKLQKGGPNPFIDPATCTLEADIQEAMFRAMLVEQKKPAQP